MANSNRTVAIRRSGEWWIGWKENIPGVNSRAVARDERLEVLRVALCEALEVNRK